MPDLTVNVIILLLLILGNGLFSLAEFAVVSARRARLQQMADGGDENARAALELLRSPNRFLSTIQIGITLIGILAGAFGGATVAAQLDAVLSTIPAIAPYSASLSLGIVVVTITYLTLVLGEIVPKRLALQNPERLAGLVANPMRAVSLIAAPFVYVLSVSTDAVLRLFGVRGPPQPTVTEEEIRILIEQGIEAGTFEETERDMVEHVFELGDRRVNALMTPRTEIVWMDVNDTPEKIRDKIVESGHSRYPVAEGSLDETLGMVRVQDIVAQLLSGSPTDLRASLRRILFVPESIRVFKALEIFQQSGIHFALVIDEYGSVQGLITLEDILEEVVGEIPSVEELAEPMAIQREDGSWLLDGMLPVDEFKEIFGMDTLPAEDTYQTLAGFVLLQTGHIPTIGTRFEWGGLRFEVVDMDRNRIDKMLVTPLPPPAAATAGG
ncbi:MAG: hemolysin family protein [Methanomicrobiales archaeon]|nr:hemolysin family protein [Methanomicrobiales archaeon]MDI6877445.1 hemolysin family protein [Methanomicrobiales archaeon]